MIYEYSGPCGHITTKWRKMDNRHDPVDCDQCGVPVTLIISKSHVPPDGVYSYAPNVGSEWDFERKRAAIRSGKRTQEVTKEPKWNLTET